MWLQITIGKNDAGLLLNQISYPYVLCIMLDDNVHNMIDSHFSEMPM